MVPENGADYVFGLPGTQPLSKKVDDKADEVRVERALENKESCAVMPRPDTELVLGPASGAPSRVSKRTPLGLDIRFVVTNLECGSPEWIYDSLYCARGQAENLIKLHKTQLSSDRTSCRSAVANQVRLVLHTSAYWLMLTVRDAIPKHAIWPRPSSRPCAFVCSKSPLASSKPPEPCAWPSRPVIPRRPSSPACPARSPRSAPDRQGIGPFPVPFSNASSKSANLQAAKNPNDDPQPKSPRTKISEKHRCL